MAQELKIKVDCAKEKYSKSQGDLLAISKIVASKNGIVPDC